MIESGRWHYVGEAGEPAFENGWTNLASNKKRERRRGRAYALAAISVLNIPLFLLEIHERVWWAAAMWFGIGVLALYLAFLVRGSFDA